MSATHCELLVRSDRESVGLLSYLILLEVPARIRPTKMPMCMLKAIKPLNFTSRAS